MARLLNNNVDHTLITSREALKILTWVSRSGLYLGLKGTDVLSRFGMGRNIQYSRQECEALRDRILAAGASKRDAIDIKRRKVSFELV